MNCVIVDDEVMAQKVLEQRVKNTKFLNLVGIYSNVKELINGLRGRQST